MRIKYMNEDLNTQNQQDDAASNAQTFVTPQRSVPEPTQLQPQFAAQPIKQPKTSKKKLIIILIITILLIGAGVGIFLYLTKKDANKTSNSKATTSTKNEAVTYKDFTNSDYSINLANKVENISDIYAIDISYASSYSAPNNLIYNLIAHYDDESTLTIATITGSLDYRVLDFSDNKIYFLIKDDSTLFKVNYIDLDNLGEGATELTGFNNMYNESSTLCVSTGCRAYPTEIFIKNNLFYYTDFTSGSNSLLKTYNINTGEVKTISDKNIDWTNFYLDKTHNKLFYYSDDIVYISNLDGSGEINLGKDIYNGSGFFTKAIYKNSPIFGVNCKYGESFSSCDLDSFDYEKNVFVNIAKDVQKFVVKSDSIVYEAGDKDVINSFYIAR